MQRARGGLVEHREGRVQAGGDRVRAQQARAEAVDRRDPCGLGLARRVAAAELDEALAHARAQLARGALGERDREDLRRAHAVLEHRAHEALDEHRRLAAAGVGLEQQRSGAPPDGLGLLRGEGVAVGAEQRGGGHRVRTYASQRQIVGYAQPLSLYVHVAGRGCQRAGAQLVDRGEHVLEHAVDDRVELLRRAAVGAHGPQAGIGVVAHEPARARLAPADRLVQAADRIEAEHLARDEQVERDLVLALRAPVRGLDGDAALVVVDERLAGRVCVSIRSMRPRSRTPPGSSSGPCGSSGPPKSTSSSAGTSCEPSPAACSR